MTRFFNDKFISDGIPIPLCSALMFFAALLMLDSCSMLGLEANKTTEWHSEVGNSSCTLSEWGGAEAVDAGNCDVKFFVLMDPALFGQESEHYVAFGVQKDISLLVGQDTFDCVMYHCEPKISQTSPLAMHLMFKVPCKSKSSDAKVVLNVHGERKVEFSAI